MTYNVQFSVHVVPGEFELRYEILDDSVPDDQALYSRPYPSEAEIMDDLRRAHLPITLSLVGTHPPIESTDEQLRTLRAAGDQDYR